MTADLLPRALALTHRMLAAAQAQDWPRLIELEAEREPLLRGPFADPANRVPLGELLACDGELRMLVGTARDAVGQQWQQEVDRSRAIAAYEQP